jgi:hypothetical protein
MSARRNAAVMTERGDQTKPVCRRCARYALRGVSAPTTLFSRPYAGRQPDVKLCDESERRGSNHAGGDSSIAA